MWTKYSYVCTNCDALMEITTKVDPVIYPDCTCGFMHNMIQVGKQSLTTV